MTCLFLCLLCFLWLLSLCAFELAVASYTPLVPFVARILSL